MTTKPIKISEENYGWLLQVAGDLQKIKGKNITLDNALTYIRKYKKDGSAEFLLKFAGKWKMNDGEADNLKKELSEGWKKWKIKSV
ncbi:MAG: hypothetical protein AABX19_01625 [Nanoarchaeota archaeon]